MPKTNLCKDPDEKARKLLIGNIEKQMTVEGKSSSNLADVLGITLKTWREKMKNPKGFKFEELLILFKVLKFSDTQIMESMGRI